MCFRVFCLLLCLLPSNRAYCQEAITECFPDGTTWEEEKWWPGEKDENGERKMYSFYKENTVTGDTIINDAVYKKVVSKRRVNDSGDSFFWDRTSPWHWVLHHTYGIREDNGKVYYYGKGLDFGQIFSFQEEKEMLVYDFNWEVGNSVPLKYNYSYNRYDNTTINFIGSMELGDGEACAYLTDGNDPDGEPYQIKGIGDVGPLACIFVTMSAGMSWDGYDKKEHYIRVLSFTRNGELLYKWDRDEWLATILSVKGVEDFNADTNNAIYTLEGVRIGQNTESAPHPGIYIRNGKKYVVK